MESKNRAMRRPTITPKRSLSKNLSEMKFMKRNNTEERDGPSSQWAIPVAFNCHPSEQWVVPYHLRPAVESRSKEGPKMVQSYAEIMGVNPLLQGVTLNGFNPEIEKLRKSAQEWKEEEREEDGLIPAVEATAHYLSDARGQQRASKHSTSKSKVPTLPVEDEGTISLMEMASRYQTLVGNGRGLHSKRPLDSQSPANSSQPKRKHFQKP